MPRPQQIQATIDVRVTLLLPNLAARQEAYRTARKRYFQGPRTHAAPPQDGVSRPADGLGRRPSDQMDTWALFGVSAWTEPFAVEVHAYDGPRGKGWLAVLSVVIAGEHWRRVIQVGPETHRSTPWAKSAK